jgi:hypothetical protein
LDGLLLENGQTDILAGVHEAVRDAETASLEAGSDDASFVVGLAGITADLFKTFEDVVISRAEAEEMIAAEAVMTGTADAILHSASIEQNVSIDLPVSGTTVSAQDFPSQKDIKIESLSVYKAETSEAQNSAEPKPITIPVPESVEPWAGGEIAISDLHSLSGQVGFYKQSSVPGVEASEILTYFYAHFDEFELETYNGNAMIEQVGTDQLAVEDIGMWQNVMPNGLVLSVVGSASLIAEIDSWF